MTTIVFKASFYLGHESRLDYHSFISYVCFKQGWIQGLEKGAHPPCPPPL